jgi:hypothetical protein
MNLKQIDLRLVLLFVIIGLIFILAQECNRNVDLNNALTNLNNNVNALKDTISVSKNEIGKIQYEKSILVSSETGLRDLNSRLYREMQNTKSQVAQLIEVVSNLSTPPPPLTSPISVRLSRQPRLARSPKWARQSGGVNSGGLQSMHFPRAS